MRRSFRCGVTALLVSLFLAGWTCRVFASEPETEPQTQEEQTEAGTEADTEADAGAENPEPEKPSNQVEVPVTGQSGWYSRGGYKYYYDKRGRLVTGWTKIAKSWYYFTEPDQGTKPVGSMATGTTQVGGNSFFFKANGKMLIGWVKKSSGRYGYYEEKGKVGVLGRFYTDKRTVGKNTYIFNASGAARAGWFTYNGGLYYGNTTDKAGVYGSLYMGGWEKIDGYFYYFGGAGRAKTSCWIRDKFYVNESGKRLTNCVTPDGWIVGSKGNRTTRADGWVEIGGRSYYYKDGKALTGWNTLKNKKYYFAGDGEAQTGIVEIEEESYYLKKGKVMTGWIVTGGKKYYFDEDGVMQKNTRINGIKLGADGAMVTKASVLIIAGHGQGDPGAGSVMGGKQYTEANYTREFASLIYDRLTKKVKKTQVTMYDQNYDCYQVNAGKKSGPNPNFKNYDYVLEIHFDAAVRDYSGNGVYTGVSILVSASKSNRTLDSNIVNAVAATGFKKYSTGVIRRSDLLNMNLCQKMGVSYGLLETAFIDDKDDMTFYNNHKNAMANAVAKTIVDYFE